MEGVLEFNDKWVIQPLQNTQLSLCVLYLLLGDYLGAFDDLHRVQFLTLRMPNQHHLAPSPSSDDLQTAKVFHRCTRACILSVDHFFQCLGRCGFGQFHLFFFLTLRLFNLRVEWH